MSKISINVLTICTLQFYTEFSICSDMSELIGFTSSWLRWSCEAWSDAVLLPMMMWPCEPRPSMFWAKLWWTTGLSMAYCC